MNHRARINGILFAVLLAVPLIAEIITATSKNVPGTGFDVLLYEPFNFAYVFLVGVLFIFLNSYISSTMNQSMTSGMGIGTLLFAVWFAIAFLLIGQLHLSLGGKL